MQYVGCGKAFNRFHKSIRDLMLSVQVIVILARLSKLYETVNSLKVITRMVKYTRVKETDSGPSCSLAEALEKQDLFINSTLAQLGCGILWKMFRNGVIEHNGLYLNLDTMKVNSIII